MLFACGISEKEDSAHRSWMGIQS